MARASGINRLPENIRLAFERRLTEQGFSGYDDLTAWLTEQGYEVSRSAVHRYGQKIEKRFASIKASTEAARLIAEGAADEDDKRSAALMSMLQTELFDLLVAVNDSSSELEPLARLHEMAVAAKNIAPLISASTRLKQFQAAFKDKLDKRFAELEAESTQQGSGIDADTLRRIRQEVYGVMS
ncbi:DUF3486 family protein [Stenoxybacter acetivorans]|uniref:DUF3486 family protein n=1 Tax=Stenoxybacter acetivorans TaxID=422441 RepID=UPI000562847D|nr:DUF3486 family protein [Stenoxybacter acetivorans]